MQISPINPVCHNVRSTTAPHRLEYFLSNTIWWQSAGREGGEGEEGKKKLNMKGKMIWRRRRGKVDIWWRRFAVSGTTEGQSCERINQWALSLEEGAAAWRQETRDVFLRHVTVNFLLRWHFSLQNLCITKQEGTQVSSHDVSTKDGLKISALKINWRKSWRIFTECGLIQYFCSLFKFVWKLNSHYYFWI